MILTAIVVIVIVALGGYFVYTNYSSPASNAENNPTNTTADQVQVQDVTVGDGAEATPGMVVSVLYVGQMEDGTVFDSSEAHNNEPLVFTLGQPGLIPGFQIGINGMKVGGERVILVPPSLAYGAEGIKDTDGKVIIPGNVNTVFNVKLLAVQAAPPADASTTESTQ